MTTTRRTRSRHTALGVALIIVFVLSGCGTVEELPPATPEPGSGPQPIEPPSQTDAATSAALAAYTTYWEVTDAALADPGGRDWRPVLEATAQGRALEGSLAEVENYESLSARTVGTITRTPVATDVDANAVTIRDCVDLGDSRLVSETTGEVLDDLENRVQRFQLHARVVAVEGGRWLVDETVPELDEPC